MGLIAKAGEWDSTSGAFVTPLLLILMALIDDPRLNQPLDPSIWAVKEDPASGISDALILNHQIHVDKTLIDHYMLIRILSERGKDIVRDLDLSGSIEEIKGRVVERNGNSHVISKEQHLVTKDTFARLDERETSNVLIPPGLTSDCVLELAWTEKAKAGLPIDTNTKVYAIPAHFVCRIKTISFTHAVVQLSDVAFADGLFPLLTRTQWSEPNPPTEFRSFFLDGTLTLEYKDVPGIIEEPFGDVRLDPRYSACHVYRTIASDSTQALSFWNEFAQGYIRHTFEMAYDRDAEYRAWISEAKNAAQKKVGLDGAPDIAFYDILRQRIASPEWVAPQDKAKYRNVSDIQPQDSGFLMGVFHRGFAEPAQLGVVFYHMFRDAGFHLRIVVGAPSFDHAVLPNTLEPFSWDWRHIFLAVENARGDVHLFSPATPLLPAGYTPSAYRSAALSMNPDNNWSCQMVELRNPSSQSHQWNTDIKMILDRDGKILFSADVSGSGEFEALLRGRYYELPQVEQDDNVRSDWARAIPGSSILSAHVENVHQLDLPVRVSVAGMHHVDITSPWIRLPPFPGDPFPISIPETWPRHRHQNVVLPFNFSKKTRSVIKIPPGWTSIAPEPFDRSNRIGRVTFSVTRETNVLIATMRVQVENSFLPPEADADLRDFLSWLMLLDDISLTIKPASSPGGSR